MNDEKILAIDFGTSKLCGGFFDTNVSLIEAPFDRELVNFITFKDSIRIGKYSKKNMPSNFETTFFDFKILMDKTLDENLMRNIWPFRFYQTLSSRYKYKLNEEKFEPEVIFSLFLQELKEFAEKKFNNKIEKVLITVPTSFTLSARQSIIDSAKISGLEVVRLLNDNTAAAIQIAYENKIKKMENYLLFNLGYYYLNLAVFNMNYGTVEIKASKSYPSLGGKMIDYNLAKYLIKQFDIKNYSSKLFQTLLLECENAKINLSNNDETLINIRLDNQDFDFKLNRTNFDEINHRLIEKCVLSISRFLNESNIAKTSINEIFFIGGSSCIHKIRKSVSDYFENKIPINYSLNPSETVANGAIIHSAFLSNKNMINNNGYFYKDIVGHNYTLVILIDPKNIIKLSIDKFASLPIERSVIVNIDKISIWLYENGKQIHEYSTVLNDNLTVEFIITIDINGILNSIAKLYDKNHLKTVNLFDVKAQNMTKESIDFYKQNMLEFKKVKDKYLMNFNRQNDLELKSIHLKNLLQDLNFNKLVCYLDEILNSIINQLKETGSDLDSIEDELKNIEFIVTNSIRSFEYLKILEEFISKHKDLDNKFEKNLKKFENLINELNTSENKDDLVKKLDQIEHKIKLLIIELIKNDIPKEQMSRELVRELDRHKDHFDKDKLRFLINEKLININKNFSKFLNLIDKLYM